MCNNGERDVANVIMFRHLLFSFVSVIHTYWYFRYLIKEGADIAAVNNDGDLPIDICEDEEKMENLLQEEMDKQGWTL